MFNIVWRNPEGTVVFKGLIDYPSEAEAFEAVRTLWGYRNFSRYVFVERQASNED
jgi:hypothetical protein